MAEHLARTMDNTTQPPAQLLMKVLGPPGTGKSRVIDALTQHFERCNARPILQKCAHQGSAASIIGGSTLYSLLCIKVSSKTRRNRDSEEDNLSTRVIDALKERTRNIRYLIIDEISQVSSVVQSGMKSKHHHIGQLCTAGQNFAPPRIWKSDRQ